MVFMGVCRAWSTIAISTPSLWAAIRVRESDRNDLEVNRTRLMNIWFAGARNRPLSISLHGDLNSGIWQTMHRNAHQVQNLKLYLPSADHLEHIVKTPLPSLKTLLIGQGHDNGDDSDDSEAGHSGNLWIEKYYSFDARESLEMLRAVPGLVDCKFYDIHYEGENGGVFDAEPEDLTHLNLKHLYLDPSALVLKSFTLSALESLYIFHLTISHDQFLAFLTRSSPPLKSLEMEIPTGRAGSGRVTERVFRLIPSLTDLHLKLPINSRSLNITSFFEVLATGSPPHFLLNLRNLTLKGLTDTPDRAQYEKIVKTLAARRASHSSQMQTFRLLFRYGSMEHKPDADIAIVLQQLVADGMEIHIGTRESKWI
ncbi:hypothetical protein DFH09DRAFT_1389885 [Mycena vulgaris]|nr:hypothetical protein DFH09DRAFT_1389885 [Mycena vulgaris]